MKIIIIFLINNCTLLITELNHYHDTKSYNSAFHTTILKKIILGITNKTIIIINQLITTV